MYDGGKILLGLLIFLLIVLSPFWYNLAAGKATFRPDPQITTADIPGKDTCVLPEGTMRTEHMHLLNEWRERVVREDERYYVTEDGRKFEMSLTRTCLDCHSNRENFCNRCHTYMAVKLYCWDCHVVPGEVK